MIVFVISTVSVKCVINGSNNSYDASNLQHKQMLCEDTLCFVIFFLYSVNLRRLKYYSIIVISCLLFLCIICTHGNFLVLSLLL